jgi:hypothetical protein
LQRDGDQDFDLRVEHSDYAVEIRRRAEAIAFAVPKWGKVYLGQGTAHENDHLKPEGIIGRLVGPATRVSQFIPIVMNTDAEIRQAMAELRNGTFIRPAH